MLTRHIAIASATKKIGLAKLRPVAAAIQKQVTRDFAPVWGVPARVDAFGDEKDVPLHYWPVIIQDKLAKAGAAGYHEDELRQPRAHVLDIDDWSVSVSHETLEMLADPFGRHLVAGQSPRAADKRVKFLVEICDPCSYNSYEIDGVAVSDFYTPRYFDDAVASGVRYSHAGSIKEPRQVLKYGYVTWVDPGTRKWWHRTWFDGHEPVDSQIPIPDLVKGNFREVVDRHIRALRARKK
jgi:hypothetical protein